MKKILMAGIKDGKATITNYQYNTDSITFHIEADELSIIEIPRIYYLGYQIRINSNDEITNLDYFFVVKAMLALKLISLVMLLLNM
ncbi:MAG: hypothetical protein L6U99_04425 [Clostridium sp.]|nr:MAG: hypothetical protein L6U99_04425 [Clostridium sp.]